jgi:thiamine-phosphate pyrophosphorylase
VRNRIDFRLYLITDGKIVSGGGDSFEAVADALSAGIRAVQLREKALPIRKLLDLAYRMRELTAKYDAMLFVNDRVDVAMCVGADGIHLGRSGIPVHAARDVAGGRFMIGASTHNLKEALAAEKEGADFITFGPLYHTPSKRSYGEPVGTKALRAVMEEISIPVFGIGGIKTENIGDVIASGARGVAVISGILGAPDIKKSARKYIEELEKKQAAETRS